MESRARAARVAVYAALATGLYMAESVLPGPLPWLRIGVANVGVVLALYDIGAGAAAVAVGIKLVLGSLLLGRLLTPFFWLGAAGSLAGLALMVLVKTVAGRVVGPVGASAAGGVGHNLGQLAAARLLMLPGTAAAALMPVMMLTGTVSGTAVGLLVRLVQLRLSESDRAA
uniref:Heptaprenyl diphosphate synthase n=1 Tax=candidate division WOR-3 bacterium TaxID=2052148 RepID=A0A7C4G8X9_UNCW3